MQIADYCREIETYLCRKNDGHLIRVVGPSFELVSGWAASGVPLKVAFRGIDRYFERYYRNGPRRRPVRIEFCAADVLDVFDAWRRAIGLTKDPSSRTVEDGDRDGRSASGGGRGASLPVHLHRVLLRLTSARASGALGVEADALLDEIARELDRVRAAARGLRGDARRALIERLATLDAELLRLARGVLDGPARQAVEAEAEEELGAFHETMPSDAYRRAREAAVDRLVREQFGLPTLVFVDHTRHPRSPSE